MKHWYFSHNDFFVCTLSGAKAFAQKGSLTKHVSSVHENNTINKFQCEICDHKASCQVNLNLHIKVVHHKIKDHCCDKCGKKFSWAMSLKKHRFKCQINYKCDFCTGKARWNLVLFWANPVTISISITEGKVTKFGDLKVLKWQAYFNSFMSMKFIYLSL